MCACAIKEKQARKRRRSLSFLEKGGGSPDGHLRKSYVAPPLFFYPLTRIYRGKRPRFISCCRRKESGKVHCPILARARASDGELSKAVKVESYLRGSSSFVKKASAESSPRRFVFICERSRWHRAADVEDIERRGVRCQVFKKYGLSENKGVPWSISLWFPTAPRLFGPMGQPRTRLFDERFSKLL